MKLLLFLLVSWFGSVGCVHSPATTEVQPINHVPTQSELVLWVEFVYSLEAMSAKDLKGEGERWRRLSERDWDEDLRLGLVNVVQLTKSHSFQKAAESVSQMSTKIQKNSEFKTWLKLYALQLSVAAGLEKELSEEKRQRNELEKKLKALTDIEKDMSERSNLSDPR